MAGILALADERLPGSERERLRAEVAALAPAGALAMATRIGDGLVRSRIVITVR